MLRIPKGKGHASCEVRTHASFDSRVENELKSTALDHSAKLAICIWPLICITIVTHILKNVLVNIQTDILPNPPCTSHQQENGNMGQEEQIEEREVLDSIFPDEITGTSPFLPLHSPFHFSSLLHFPSIQVEHPIRRSRRILINPSIT